MDSLIKGDRAMYLMLEEIRPKVGMFLGSVSLTRLQAFMGGFCYANHEEVQHTVFPLPFQFFNEFIKNYYGYYESTSGWRNMILESNDNDEEKSVEVFYNHIDNFKNLTAKSCFYTQVNRSNTQGIYIFELTQDAGFLAAIEFKNKIQLHFDIEKSFKKASSYFCDIFEKGLEWRKISPADSEFSKPICRY